MVFGVDPQPAMPKRKFLRSQVFAGCLPKYVFLFSILNLSGKKLGFAGWINKTLNKKCVIQDGT